MKPRAWFLFVCLLGALVLAGCTPRSSRGNSDDDDNANDDDSAVDDDDSAADDDDVVDDDDATADDDDATADDDDATSDDDDATADDDDATADDDDATADDDDATGDDDDATAPPLASGDVVVTEMMIDAASVDDADGEWIELRNRTGFPIDLSGWTLADRDSDSVTISPSAPLILPANGYVVLGRSDQFGSNGGAPVDWAYGTAFTMAQGADEVVLLGPTGAEIFGLDYQAGFAGAAGVSVMYPGSGVPPWPAVQAPSAWCYPPSGSPTYGLGDRGTPGVGNGSC